MPVEALGDDDLIACWRLQWEKKIEDWLEEKMLVIKRQVKVSLWKKDMITLSNGLRKPEARFQG